MFCAISGNTPEHPVVSKTGHLFEQSVIEKYIESTGKCPVTGEALSPDDLLPLKVSSTVKPRPVAASSIPGMLTLFQNEWDALMLETFTLKQQLETARQELGQALYQHDAACRVIARLIKERDDARQALAEARPSAVSAPAASAAPAAPAAAAMEVDGASGMTPAVISRFEANAKGLSKGRKKRQPPADQATAEAIASFSALGSAQAHSKGHTCVGVHASEPLAATGGADGHVSLYDCATGSTTATLKGHTKKVNGVSLHPTKPIVLSCSADKTARCWNTDGEQLHVLSTHSGSVTACTLHSTGDYAVTASTDKSWALHDLETGSPVFVVGGGTAGYSCAGFHPDGLILGTGTEATMRIWDVKSRAVVAALDSHQGAISCLAFSENGFYMATGAADATVKLWDLRKTKNFHTITPAAGGTISSVQFDYTGQFLTVGSNDVSVYESKGWSTVASFTDHKAAVTGVGFGRSASLLVATAADGIVKHFGAAP